MKLEASETGIAGCFDIRLPRSDDKRGSFIKLFRATQFSEIAEFEGVCALREIYLTRSRPRVIRGLHLQVAPHELTKIVVCLEGAVLDAMVDLRLESPTFGDHIVRELSAEGDVAVAVAPGCAHGFCVTSDAPASLLYLTTAEYAPESDTGIRWDSAGIRWPDLAGVEISDRDLALPTLDEFASLRDRRYGDS